MRGLRLSMACMNPVLGDIAGNLSKVLSVCDEAASRGTDILCLPELCLTGYSMPGSTRFPMSPDSPEVGTVVDRSAETGMCVCFGYMGEDMRITQAVAENGRILGEYHKTHLGEREVEAVRPGDSLDVIRTSRAVLGIQLCWEIHFPGITETYALKGADLVLMPAASGLGGERRRSAWDRVIPARAYDNTVYAAACNAVGDNGAGVSFGGGAAVYDMRGRKMAEDFSGECILTADLNPEPLETIRAEGYESMRDVYFLDKRRPELYL